MLLIQDASVSAFFCLCEGVWQLLREVEWCMSLLLCAEGAEDR